MKHRVYAAVLVTLLVGGCATAPKPTAENELRERIGALEQNVTDMKKSVDGAVKRQAELSMLMLSLENKIAEASDKNTEAMDRVDNLEERIGKLSAAPATSKPPQAPVVAEALTAPVLKPSKQRSSSRATASSRKSLKAEVVSAEKLYQLAYNNYEKGRISEALEQFSEFADKYPKSSLTDNAYYWIGEIYYGRRDFAQAILEFQRVVNEFPDENKAPEALYKIGLTYLELRNPDKAKQEFRKLINNFPYSEKAALAKEKLASLE